MPAPSHSDATALGPGARTALLTVLALLAFAGNSVLCRMALGDAAIDASSFTALRLFSGAVALYLLHRFFARQRDGGRRPRPGSWVAAIMLFTYAAAFSFAYLGLDTGTGALILFGMVQLTMVAAALRSGSRPGTLEWLGWLAACAGLLVLVAPGLTAPPLTNALLMAAAGIAWGVYSLKGRGESDPLGSTTFNFVRASPLALGLVLVGLSDPLLSASGVVLAVVSGAITSGAGYAIWYAALRDLSTFRAAMVQLSVPAIAAVGGVMLLDESLSPRLLASATLVLGGIALAIAGRRTDSR
ncbi:MAG: DMT family transporter [Rhodocyclaceae bacterium]